ncbi:MAG TPA: hypothetical protein PK246_09555, partial [Saprospiraceae bacterium]|nr:hypothetical protein [Saprospiraceae bacterium]
MNCSYTHNIIEIGKGSNQKLNRWFFKQSSLCLIKQIWHGEHLWLKGSVKKCDSGVCKVIC